MNVGNLPDGIDPLTEQSHTSPAKKAKVVFQTTLHEIQQLTSQPTSNFKDNLVHATQLVHKLFSAFSDNEQQIDVSDAQALTDIQSKFKEVTEPDAQVFKELQILQKALELKTHPTSKQYTITAAQIHKQTPREFLELIAKVLQENPALREVKIEGQGNFERRELANIVSLELCIEPQKLRKIVDQIEKPRLL